MSLPAIRDELAAILFATPPVGVNGATIALNQSLAYQPQLPPEVVPCAWLGDSTGDVEMSGFEIWTHRLPITVAVSEAGSAEMERSTIEAFLLAVVAHLRGHIQLNQTCMACSVTAYEEGIITFQSKPYRGFTLTAEIVEKFEASTQYHS